MWNLVTFFLVVEVALAKGANGARDIVYDPCVVGYDSPCNAKYYWRHTYRCPVTPSSSSKLSPPHPHHSSHDVTHRAGGSYGPCVVGTVGCDSPCYEKQGRGSEKPCTKCFPFELPPYGYLDTT